MQWLYKTLHFFPPMNTVLITTHRNKSSVFTCTVYWRKCTKCDALTGRSVSRWKVSIVVRSQSLQSLFKGAIPPFQPSGVLTHNGCKKKQTKNNVPVMLHWHHPSSSLRDRNCNVSVVCRVWDLQGEILDRNIVAIKKRWRSRSREKKVSSAQVKGIAKLWPPELFKPFFFNYLIVHLLKN